MKHLYGFVALPKAFQAAVHGLIKAVSYSEGIHSTIRVGGCNASRSAFIGACFGAMVSSSFYSECQSVLKLRTCVTCDIIGAVFNVAAFCILDESGFNKW